MTRPETRSETEALAVCMQPPGAAASIETPIGADLRGQRITIGRVCASLWDPWPVDSIELEPLAEVRVCSLVSVVKIRCVSPRTGSNRDMGACAFARRSQIRVAMIYEYRVDSGLSIARACFS